MVVSVPCAAQGDTKILAIEALLERHHEQLRAELSGWMLQQQELVREMCSRQCASESSCTKNPSGDEPVLQEREPETFDSHLVVQPVSPTSPPARTTDSEWEQRDFGRVTTDGLTDSSKVLLSSLTVELGRKVRKKKPHPYANRSMSVKCEVITKEMADRMASEGKIMDEFMSLATLVERPPRHSIVEAEESDCLEASSEFLHTPHLYPTPTIRNRLRRFVNRPQFEGFFAVLIVSNAIWTGVEIDYKARAFAETTPPALYIVVHVYNLLFFVELLLRVVADGWQYVQGKERYWNVLDVLVVSAAVLETVVDIVSAQGRYGGSAIENVSSTRIVRMLRIARLGRILRVGRVLRFIGALRTMVQSIFATLYSLVWAMLLLLMIMYVFAMLFTQSASDHLRPFVLEDREYGDMDAFLAEYWGTVPRSMYSLFLAISGGVSWIEIASPLTIVPTNELYVTLLIIYVCFTYFAVLNVVTAVFCQTAIDSAQRDETNMIEEAKANKDMYVARLKQLFSRFDADESGNISLEEIERGFRVPEIKEYFDALNLTSTHAAELFILLDSEMNGEVDLEEFVLGILQMRGFATGLDTMRVLHSQKKMMKALTLIMKHIDDRLFQIEEVRLVPLQNSVATQSSFQQGLQRNSSYNFSVASSLQQGYQRNSSYEFNPNEYEL